MLLQISFKKVITFQKKVPLYLNIKHIYSMQVKIKLKIIWRLPKPIIFECIFKALKINQHIPQVDSDSSITSCQIELCTVVFLS